MSAARDDEHRAAGRPRRAAAARANDRLTCFDDWDDDRDESDGGDADYGMGDSEADVASAGAAYGRRRRRPVARGGGGGSLSRVVRAVEARQGGGGGGVVDTVGHAYVALESQSDDLEDAVRFLKSQFDYETQCEYELYSGRWAHVEPDERVDRDIYWFTDYAYELMTGQR